ncbi:phosphoribosylglycinamide synthetase [Bifidobacterium magnum]|nr:phosphoribosylglycinamide synthetase [Bifidobacterium magnum]
MSLAAERLSIVRYVYLVQIEEGIASAEQRASLEYADAVLIGWPDESSKELVTINEQQMNVVRTKIREMEEYIAKFRVMESRADIDSMTDTLIRVTERVADIRRLFEPSFLLPTFAEIRRVVQDEWDEDMGRINPEASEVDLTEESDGANDA